MFRRFIKVCQYSLADAFRAAPRFGAVDPSPRRYRKTRAFFRIFYGSKIELYRKNAKLV